MTTTTSMNVQASKMRVVIVGNHFFYSAAMERIIAGSENFELTSKFNNISELMLDLESSMPEVIFWNVSKLSSDNSTEYIQHITSMIPSVKVVCISTEDEGTYVKNMLEAGVIGFITTTSSRESFNDMLNYVYSGKKYISPTASMNYTLFMSDKQPESLRDKFLSTLTKRETDVLRELVKGLTCKQIGVRLSVSYKTVEVHVQNMMRKFNVNKSVELVAMAIRYQLV